MTAPRRHRRKSLAWSDKHGIYIAPAHTAPQPPPIVFWDTARGLLLLPGLTGLFLRLAAGCMAWAAIFAVFGYGPGLLAWLRDLLVAVLS